jgi:uncharacterized OB-fold protein
VVDPKARPVPLPDDVSRPFWEGCARGELRIQRCAACGRLRFTPQILCPACRSAECEWAPVSGKGVVYSRVVCHPPVLPAFQERVPYAVVLVELDEDPSLRLVGNLLDCPAEEIRIGSPVRVAFEDLGDGIVLPQWRLAEPGGDPS